MRIFISHSHLDSDIAIALVDFLTNGVGIDHKSIFCSSIDGKDVPLGLNFNDYILKELQGEKANVLAVITNNYYNSKYCLYELGAAWGLCKTVIPVLIPPMQYANLRDFISQNIAIQSTNEKDLNKLRDDLHNKFVCNQIPTSTFEKYRKLLIETIKVIVNNEKELIQVPKSKISINKYRYKAVAFDFDGTILQGNNFDYSWKEVWNHLGYDDQIRDDLYRKHKDKSLNYSYEEWCNDCGKYFIKKKMNKRHISEIITKRNLKPAPGLLTTLEGLKKHGFKTAIISGGINTFYDLGLDESIKALVDKVYINNFHYDSNGFLERVTPYQNTESDFIGKVKAFEDFCRYAGCSISEGVFVGEGYNDIDLASHILQNNGLSVAYPAARAEREYKQYAKAKIFDENISALLSEVLVPSLAKKNHYRTNSVRR